MTTIGERLKEAREELQRARGERPNQAKFAREIGIEPPSLNGIESGETKQPAASTLMRIRDAGISEDYVMHGKGPKLLVDRIERQITQQTVLGLMEEMDDAQQQVVLNVSQAIIRKKPGASASDPFKEDPPNG